MFRTNNFSSSSGVVLCKQFRVFYRASYEESGSWYDTNDTVSCLYRTTDDDDEKILLLKHVENNLSEEKNY